MTGQRLLADIKAWAILIGGTIGILFILGTLIFYQPPTHTEPIPKWTQPPICNQKVCKR